MNLYFNYLDLSSDLFYLQQTQFCAIKDCIFLTFTLIIKYYFCFGFSAKKHFRGKAVSPSYPSKYNGIYWGYNVRLANNLNSVFTECPFKGGYDVCVGTSEKGGSVDEFQMPSFKYVFFL